MRVFIVLNGPIVLQVFEDRNKAQRYINSLLKKQGLPRAIFQFRDTVRGYRWVTSSSFTIEQHEVTPGQFDQQESDPTNER